MSFEITIPDINTARVWLITGCPSGFGRQIAIAAAQIGDTVVASTSRDVQINGPTRVGQHYPS